MHPGRDEREDAGLRLGAELAIVAPEPDPPEPVDDSEVVVGDERRQFDDLGPGIREQLRRPLDRGPHLRVHRHTRAGVEVEGDSLATHVDVEVAPVDPLGRERCEVADVGTGEELHPRATSATVRAMGPAARPR